jgi:flagellar assembly protein FliH
LAPKIIKSAKFEDGSYAIAAPRMGVAEQSIDADVSVAAPSDAQDIIQNAHMEAALIIQDAQGLADMMLQQARAKAQQEANHISEEAREQAAAEGFEVGLERGRQEAIVQVAKQLEALKQADREAQDRRAAQLQDLEHEVLELSLGIAAKLVAVELGHSRQGAVAIVRAALQHLSERQRVRLRVHPLDLHLLTQSKQMLVNGVDGLSELELVPDTRLGLGGCVVETTTGTIDARLSTQLREIAFHLLNATPTVDGEALPAHVQAAIRALGPTPLGEAIAMQAPLGPAVPQAVPEAPEPFIEAPFDGVPAEVAPTLAEAVVPIVTVEAATWDEAIVGALPQPAMLLDGATGVLADGWQGAAQDVGQVMGQDGLGTDDAQAGLEETDTGATRPVSVLNKRGGKGLRGMKPRSG